MAALLFGGIVAFVGVTAAASYFRVSSPSSSESLHALQELHAALRQRDWESAERLAEQGMRQTGERADAHARAWRREAAAAKADLRGLKLLSDASLEEMVQLAAQQPFSAWSKTWRHRFQGRTVAWCVSDEYALQLSPTQELDAHGPPFLIDWGLSVQEQEELRTAAGPHCFTLRLEACRLEDRDGTAIWVVRFAPGSLQRLNRERFGPLPVRRFAELRRKYSAEAVSPMAKEISALVRHDPCGFVVQLWRDGQRESICCSEGIRCLDYQVSFNGGGAVVEGPVVRKPASLQKK